MGMRIDTARTQKCLYGISKGMSTKELIDYTGYGARTVKKIVENPEEYERKLEETKKEEEEEWIPLWAEVFAYEWEKVTRYIKKYAGWEDKKNAAHN